MADRIGVRVKEPVLRDRVVLFAFVGVAVEEAAPFGQIPAGAEIVGAHVGIPLFAGVEVGRGRGAADQRPHW